MKKENEIIRKELFCSQLSDCCDGDVISELFYLADVKYSSNRKANRWLSIKLADRTGQCRAKIWTEDIRPEYEGYLGMVILVRGKMTLYNGQPDICVEQLYPMEEGTYDPEDFQKSITEQKKKSCIDQVQKMLETLRDEELKYFCRSLLTQQTLEKMSTLPVTLKNHHTYRGALLEHTVEVAVQSYFLAKSTRFLYKLDEDLLLAGALLHDLGVLEAIHPRGFSFELCTENRLLGERYPETSLLQRAKQEIQMSTRRFAELYHIIQSSHLGEEPKTREAMVVHSCNLLSMDLSLYEDAFAEFDGRYEGNGCEYIKSSALGREIIRRKEKKAL